VPLPAARCGGECRDSPVIQGRSVGGNVSATVRWYRAAHSKREPPRANRERAGVRRRV